MIEIKNLHVSIGERKILDGLNLTVKDGEVAAIMGPNGTGKSTLSYVISGRDGYDVTEGEVLLDGENILDLEPHERAAKGVFLAFQYPVEIPGVATMTFLKAAVNAQRRSRGEEELQTPDFMKMVREAADQARHQQDMLKRALNVGFSGGEKKRMDILQMSLLQPKFGILDETDSGLDIDALRIVSEGVNALRSPEPQLPRHHPLSAPARLHQAGHRACDGAGQDSEDRRAGARARAREERLSRLCRRSGVRISEHDRAGDRQEKRSRDGARRRLRGDEGQGRAPRCARPRGSSSRAKACRRVASRRGTTPICARRCASSRRSARRARSPLPPATEGRVRLVVADGAFRPELSDVAALPAGVELASLADVLAKDDAAVLAALGLPENAGADAIVALNAALMQDGVVLRIAPATEVAKTIEILLLSSGGEARVRLHALARRRRRRRQGEDRRDLARPRALRRAGEPCARLLDRRRRRGRAYRRHRPAVAKRRSACSACSSTAQAKASFKSLRLHRRRRPRAAADLRAARRRGGERLARRRSLCSAASDHADTTLVVEHAAANCKSRERFRNVLDGQSTGVFQGKVGGAPRRAEDRRLDAVAGAAAQRKRHDEQQAGARNLRRRRASAAMAPLAAGSTTTSCSISWRAACPSMRPRRC